MSVPASAAIPCTTENPKRTTGKTPTGPSSHELACKWGFLLLCLSSLQSYVLNRRCGRYWDRCVKFLVLNLSLSEDRCAMLYQRLELLLSSVTEFVLLCTLFKMDPHRFVKDCLLQGSITC
jgi:hypothetical protein